MLSLLWIPSLNKFCKVVECDSCLFYFVIIAIHVEFS